MGNLRDELKKAGLLNEKDIRRVHQQEQQRKKDLGKQGVAEEDRRRQAEAEARAKAQAIRDRELARQQQVERERREKQEGTRASIERAIRTDVGGPRRFHFVTRAQTIVYLELSPDAARRLEAGELAIIEKPSDASFAPDHFAVVPRDTAELVHKLQPDAVRFWQSPP